MKLGEMKEAYRNESIESKKEALKKQIIEREDYCINVMGFKLKRFDFVGKTWRFEGQKMGEQNIPLGSRTGADRCGICKYNKHTYCTIHFDEDHEDFKACQANV